MLAGQLAASSGGGECLLIESKLCSILLLALLASAGSARRLQPLLRPTAAAAAAARAQPALKGEWLVVDVAAEVLPVGAAPVHKGSCSKAGVGMGGQSETAIERCH